MGNQVYIATESGAVEVDGQTLVFKKGITTVEEGHRLLDQVPDYFRQVDAEINYENTTTEERQPARRSRKQVPVEGGSN